MRVIEERLIVSQESENVLTPITNNRLPLTFCQLPSTYYRLPGFPYSNRLSEKKLGGFFGLKYLEKYSSDSGAVALSVAIFNQVCDQVWGDSVMLRPSPKQCKAVPICGNKCGIRFGSRILSVIYSTATKYVCTESGTKVHRILMISIGWRGTE